MIDLPPVYRSQEITRREQLGDLCNRRGAVKYAVEIGVDVGRFAREFLSRWKGFCYLGVDPWEADLPGYAERFDHPREADYQIAAAVLSEFAGRARLLRMTSREAADWVRTRGYEVSLVYIDGNHSYDGCREDLALWWPILSDQGILAGHDYDPAHDGVIRAVDEFAARAGATVYLTGEPRFRSWYVYKSDCWLAAQRRKIHERFSSPPAAGRAKRADPGAEKPAGAAKKSDR